MTRILLQYLNAPLFALLVLIGVALQSSLFNSQPLIYVQPDLVLLAVIWCGLEREFLEGGILTLIFAYFAELHSSAPRGLIAVEYMLMYLTTRLVIRLLVIPNRASLIMMTMGASILAKLINWATLWQLGAADGHWRHFLIYVFPGAMAEGLAAFAVYRLFERFDWHTYKNARARNLLEDELLLEGEGF